MPYTAIADGMISAMTQRSVVPQESNPWIGSYQNQYSQNSRQAVDRPPSQVMFGMPGVAPFRGAPCHSSRRRYGKAIAAMEHRTNDQIQAQIPFSVLKIPSTYRYRQTSDSTQVTAIATTG